MKKSWQNKDSDYWLLKYARKWGYPINLEEVNPDYYHQPKNQEEKEKENERRD